MGIFDFLKKTETTEATNKTVESIDKTCLGVLELFPMLFITRL